MLEKSLESPLDWKEIISVNPIGNQPWLFIGKTDAEAPILWLPDKKDWFIGKDLNAGKDRGLEDKGGTEDEMVDGIIDSMDMSLSWFQETVKDRETCRTVVHGDVKS